MITLYDLASNLTPQAWSVSTWKTRFVLNYKKIPYKTEWICGPDIKDTFDALPGYKEAIGKSGATIYRVPLIIDDRSDPAHTPSDSQSHPTIVSDSLLIALYLDSTYPATPRVFPPGTQALQAAWTEMLNERFLLRFIPLGTPYALNVMRDEREREYYRKTREAWLKCPLEEYCPIGSEKEEAAWKSLCEGLDVIAGMMDKNEGAGKGIWVMGSEGPTWADFNIASAFVWLQKAGIPGGWAKIKDRNGGRWGKMMEALKPFLDGA